MCNKVIQNDTYALKYDVPDHFIVKEICEKSITVNIYIAIYPSILYYVRNI